jgi:hypothetical protein
MKVQTKKYKLTRVHWAKAAAIAYDRTVEKEVWQEKIQSSKNGLLHAATIGALGEIMFSELTGLPVDTAVYDRGDKCDFSLGDLRIAIKTREWSGNKLEMHLFPDEPKRSDLFVLFRIGNRCDQIELIGHITSEHILDHYRPEYHQHLYGRKVLVPAFAFNRPNEIFELVRSMRDQTSQPKELPF